MYTYIYHELYKQVFDLILMVVGKRKTAKYNFLNKELSCIKSITILKITLYTPRTQALLLYRSV